MSHITTCKVEVRDEEALREAAKACGFTVLEPGEHDLYERSVSGIGVELPGWQYPVVADPESGELSYDNYNGRWGELSLLDQFLQEYTAAVISQQAAEQGYSCTREYDRETNDLTITVDSGY